MGSSKKHKEKDKDRERRHKHKDRDKDRDKERKHRSKHRHRDRHAEKDVEAGEVSSPEQRSDRKRRRSPSPLQIKIENDDGIQDNERQDAAPSGGDEGGFAASLSIEATNKLRAKLGLAPLNVDGEGSGEPGEIVEEKKDVHKPAVNISDLKKTAALKEKMAQIREKRLINKKLHKVKVLADDDDDDDAAAWVERMRKKQIAKAEADKMAKMLEEMDAEFGIGKIVEDEFSKTKEQAYSRRNLDGFKIEHSTKNFQEGQSVILTLKDMDGLQEEEDVLVNVNMIDNERAKKNVELRKKRPDYKAYQEDDFDEEGTFHQKKLLGKYDEEIEGEQKKSFRLNQAGTAHMDEADHMQSIRNQLKQQAVSLDMKAPAIASEYYTVAEVETFKKPKKKRRKMKVKSILDELTPEADAGRDHGQRGGIRRRHREEEEDDSETPVVRKVERRVPQQDAMDMEVDFPDADQIPIEFGRERDDNDDIWGQVIEDEAEKELHNVLNKARKLKQKSKSSQRVEDQVAKVVASIKEEPEDDEEAAASASNKGSNIVFNSTSEFCRTLGDIPSYGKSGLRDEEEETLADNEKEDEEEEAMEDEDEEEAAGAWNTVNMDDREEIKQEEEELGPVLDDEPPLQVGIAGALTLATKKGYLIKEKKKKTGDSLILTSKNCTIEEKNFNDIDSKYNKNDRFRGPLMDFKEKSGYKPEVKITYTDETGRSLNQKEAFRVLSHRFHGKGSGKMKTEKRAKKVLEEEAMKKMSSTDTPLHTVARMQEKQKNLQSAHIVLSGGSKTMTAHSITK
ncbi:U4/U6.U5 tri-snRNP-associated protein 1 [Strongylocentrotus purpuratus]|uniref:U4/U6.U5 tri-snRNP-associated protein 1 n=1 Tax=Strongylocentrotus purpuratus TaxID=7668 RepID=A0A7M7PR10_STRPU|nr:U4/U6.U5 tri-snRNP-associated protein 1 [Strongylocentrotus purpuratus]